VDIQDAGDFAIAGGLVLPEQEDEHDGGFLEGEEK
jgi:hypothetical protein